MEDCQRCPDFGPGRSGHTDYVCQIGVRNCPRVSYRIYRDKATLVNLVGNLYIETIIEIHGEGNIIEVDHANRIAILKRR